ncbi:MAG: ATP-binding cassette domain-containing protein, partial [Bacteroidales bacterium]|nr:ATP-binding cassette domain-containing protein [Bacteroidales bacterium]
MEQDRTPLIRFEKCDIKGGEQTVIYDLRMVVEKGDFVYITGRVGSGKTSIIRTITAENEVCGGVAQVCGFDLVRIRRRDIPRLRRHLGVIFQDFRLLSELSVEDNLEFVLKATGWKNAREREARIGEVLRSVGMQDKSHRMPHQLSGGEQQRVS